MKLRIYGKVPEKIIISNWETEKRFERNSLGSDLDRLNLKRKILRWKV